jgi:hypothetical protein
MAAFVPPPSPLLQIKRPLLRSGNSVCGDVVATDAVPDLSIERSFRSKEREFCAIESPPLVLSSSHLVLFPQPISFALSFLESKSMGSRQVDVRKVRI